MIENEKKCAKKDVENMTVTAIIPALNEEVSIGTVVLKTRKYVDSVVVIDDGSTDNTSEIAKLAGAEIIRHSKNRGKGEALKTGFSAARQNGTKIIVTIDADGQHDPGEIPKVIEPILSGEADMVIGSRYLNGNSIPIYRRIGQRILDRATNISGKINVTDTQSGFRAFALHTTPIFRFEKNGFSIESEMLVDAADAKLKIKEVDIGVRYDVDCSTENPVIHGMKVLTNILYDMCSKKPLHYFTVPGLILTIVGGISLGFILGKNLTLEILIAMSLIVIGIIMVLIGYTKNK